MGTTPMAQERGGTATHTREMSTKLYSGSVLNKVVGRAVAEQREIIHGGETVNDAHNHTPHD